MAKLSSILLLILISLTFIPASLVAAPVKDWTYLIYIPNSKELTDHLQNNIIDLEHVGSDNNVNVLVQLGSTFDNKSYRLYINQKKTTDDVEDISSTVLKELGNIDTGDYHQFEDFIAWAVQNYPARHYFIEISGHGDGWIKPIYQPVTSPDLKMPGLDYLTQLSIGRDKNTNHYIATKELADSLRYAKKIIGHNVDIYGSDACEMGQIEVAYEMADSVDFFIGSQDTTPDHGWDYSAILGEWQSMSNPTPEQVTKLVIQHNLKFYQNAKATGKTVSETDLNDLKNQGYTVAAYDLSKLPALTQAIAILKEDILGLSEVDREKILNKEKQALHFTDEYNTDLLDFLDKLVLLGIPNLNPQHIGNIKIATNQMIIANGAFGNGVQPSGVSILFPVEWKEHEKQYVSEDYPLLKFHQETHWGDAVNYIWHGAKGT